MLICNHCGCTVEESDLSIVKEPHGEEHIDYVCSCGGDFVDAKQCPICENWFAEEETYSVCETCMKEYETVGEALDVGDREKVSVDGINGFIAEVLSVEQINKVLTKWVEENFIDHSKPVVEYCENDKQYFCDYLAEVYGF
jgi:hypothetical protein